jgi:hypothetical protein
LWKKLGSGKGASKEITDSSTPAAKPKLKAKSKEDADKGRKGQDTKPSL